LIALAKYQPDLFKTKTIGLNYSRFLPSHSVRQLIILSSPTANLP